MRKVFSTFVRVPKPWWCQPPDNYGSGQQQVQGDLRQALWHLAFNVKVGNTRKI
jgi:hypothetical protein